MFKDTLLYILSLSLMLMGCSNNESVELESKKPVVEETDSMQQTATDINESEELYGNEMVIAIEENGYTVKEVDEYEGLKIKDTEQVVKFTIKRSGNDFQDLCDSYVCKYVSYDNAIFEFDDSIRVNRIILIKDENGNEVDPASLSFIKETAKQIAEGIMAESNEDINKRINESKTIRIGMTTDEVLARWGEPEDIKRTITAVGTDEQWIYPNYTYVYFEGGILKAIQD